MDFSSFADGHCFVYLWYTTYGMTQLRVQPDSFCPGRVRNTLLITLAGSLRLQSYGGERCFYATADCSTP